MSYIPRNQCPLCGGPTQTTIEDVTFPYGADEDAVEIPVTLKIINCEQCEESILDEDAETAKSEAVNRYLYTQLKETKALLELAEGVLAENGLLLDEEIREPQE